MLNATAGVNALGPRLSEAFERNDMSEIDLDNPADALKFLRGVRFMDKHITHVHLEGGRQVAIEDLTAEQVVRYAKDVYLDYCGGVEGVAGEIDLHGIDQ